MTIETEDATLATWALSEACDQLSATHDGLLQQQGHASLEVQQARHHVDLALRDTRDRSFRAHLDTRNQIYNATLLSVAVLLIFFGIVLKVAFLG